MLLSASRSFLYLLEAFREATDPSFLDPKFSRKNKGVNDYFQLSVQCNSVDVSWKNSWRWPLTSLADHNDHGSDHGHTEVSRQSAEQHLLLSPWRLMHQHQLANNGGNYNTLAILVIASNELDFKTSQRQRQ